MLAWRRVLVGVAFDASAAFARGAAALSVSGCRLATIFRAVGPVGRCRPSVVPYGCVVRTPTSWRFCRPLGAVDVAAAVLGRADRFAWCAVTGPVGCGILGWLGGSGLESPARGVASLPRGRRPRVALQRVSRGGLLRMIGDVLLGCVARSRCTMLPRRSPACGVA